MNRAMCGFMVLLLLVIAVPLGVLANGEDQNDFPHILKEQAIELTHTVIDQLISRGELPARWREGVVVSAQLELTIFGPEWQIVVAGPVGAVNSDRSLYVFSAEGEYLGANFTGN